MTAKVASALCWLCALVLALCIVTRFPPIAAHLGRYLPIVVYAVAGGAIFAVAACEARIGRGSVGPLWMQMAWPAKLALALGMSFGTTVIAQVLAWSLGPVDPSFSSKAPAAVKTMWFFMFTIGFSGVGMMSAPDLLRFLDRPGQLSLRIPFPLALVIFAGLGVGLGLAFADLLVWRPVVQIVHQGQQLVADHQVEVTIAMLAITLAPVIFRRKASA